MVSRHVGVACSREGDARQSLPDAKRWAFCRGFLMIGVRLATPAPGRAWRLDR